MVLKKPFQVGDIVIAKKGAPYSITSEGVLCHVLELLANDDLMMVSVVIDEDVSLTTEGRIDGFSDNDYMVRVEYFKSIDSNHIAKMLLNKGE